MRRICRAQNNFRLNKARTQSIVGLEQLVQGSEGEKRFPELQGRAERHYAVGSGDQDLFITYQVPGNVLLQRQL